MKSKYTFHYALLLVLLAHAGVLGAILFGQNSPSPLVIEPSTIQGVIVTSEPIEKPAEHIPPPPEPKALPKPKIHLPEAPPTERTITEEVKPESAPQVEPQKATEPVSAPVVPPRADAAQLNNPAPIYPALSRRLGEEGIVLLEILVKADGSLGDMRLKKSSGSDRLDDAALRAVKNWHFVPANRGGEAIDFRYELPIEFSLNH